MTRVARCTPSWTTSKASAVFVAGQAARVDDPALIAIASLGSRNRSRASLFEFGIDEPIERTYEHDDPVRRRWRTSWLAPRRAWPSSWGNLQSVHPSDPSSDPASVLPSVHHRPPRNRTNLQVGEVKVSSVYWSDSIHVRVQVHARLFK